HARSRGATPAPAPVREAAVRRGSALHHGVPVASDRAPSRQGPGLDDQPQPLPQPAARRGLAQRVAGDGPYTTSASGPGRPRTTVRLTCARRSPAPAACCCCRPSRTGVEYLFTNPGSAETGIFAALAEAEEHRLVVGKHEGLVAAMADGYHRLSGKVGVVIAHVMGGSWQLAGQLFNAQNAGSALLVVAGDWASELQDYRG